MKTSFDSGESWGPLYVIWDDESNTCSNPAPIYVAATREIILLATHNRGGDSEQEIVDETSKGTREIFILKSENNGSSWSKPKNITDNVKMKNWTWYTTGPGSGIQLKNKDYEDRLIIGCGHIESPSKNKYAHVIYSDDNGETWNLGGTTPRDKVSECEVAELSDGRLMLNMRNEDPDINVRQVAHSIDGGFSWSDMVYDEDLIEPGCHASLHTHDYKVRGKPILTFSNPANHENSVNMTIRFSDDDGRNWPSSIKLFEGPSAYSDIISVDKKTVGILFECGENLPYDGIQFQKVDIPKLNRVK